MPELMTIPAPHAQGQVNRGIWPGRKLPLPWLLGLGVVIVSLRLPYLDHVVGWDEAWNLCALKAMAGGSSLFANQFWRHPPIYMLLGRLLDPLGPGFASRMQFLSLLLNTGTLLAFVILVSRLYGRRIALYTGLAYAFLPGALFFDTWVKQDPVATLFGTLSLLTYSRRNNWLAGLLLGLAFLGKETAVYYAWPFLFLPWLFRHRQKKWAGVGLIYALAIGVSAWWYIKLAASGDNFTAFFFGTSREAEIFFNPWWFYLTRLPVDLGLPGVVLFGMGLVAVFSKPWKLSRCGVQGILQPRLLPLLILLPAYLLLSTSHGKPAWMIIGLYPALALLIALGWRFLTKLIANQGSRFRAGLNRIQTTPVSGLLLVLLLGLPGLVNGTIGKFGYPLLFQRFDPSSLRLVQDSSRMADAVNSLTRPREKLLILPMIYRDAPFMLDPVFFWQLEVPLDVVRSTRELNLDYRDFRTMIIKGKVDWVLMSPIKGSNQAEIYRALHGDPNPPRGYVLGNTVLLKVDGLWREAVK